MCRGAVCWWDRSRAESHNRAFKSTTTWHQQKCCHGSQPKSYALNQTSLFPRIGITVPGLCYLMDDRLTSFMSTWHNALTGFACGQTYNAFPKLGMDGGTSGPFEWRNTCSCLCVCFHPHGHGTKDQRKENSVILVCADRPEPEKGEISEIPLCPFFYPNG